MTTHAPPTPATPRRRSRAGIGKAVAALVALVALIAGPPAALVAFVGDPIPHQAVIGGQLTDSAIIGMLAAIVWAAWAQLMLATTIEAIAAVRGGAIPRRIPLCGFQQHLARRLVVTASLLLAGTGSTLTAAGAGPAVAAVAPAAVTSCTPGVTTALGPFPQTPSIRTGDPHPVLSTSHSANVPRVANAAVLPAAPSTSPQRDTQLWYVVQPPHGRHHDSLWDIAERHLGDGMRWHEIHDLNRHRPQPDGQRLELARLIQPGWRLLMPPDATGIGAQPEHAPAERHTAIRPQTTVEGAASRAVVPHARSAPATDSSIPRPQPTLAAAVNGSDAVDAVHRSHAAAEASTNDAGHDDVEVPFGKLTLGLTAFACAGIAGELARRRRRAQRHRRPGERLRIPGAEAAATERILRTANAEITVNLLRQTLQVLAENCSRAGRSLPVLHAVQLNAERATLVLGSDEQDAVAPFTADGPRTWHLDAVDVPTAEEHNHGAADPVDPYSALVAIGVTGDSVVLINLEAAGTLHVSGDPLETGPILNALVAELGTSTLTSTVNLVLVGLPAELASIVDVGRTAVLDPERAAKWVRARRDEVAAILSDAGVTDLGAARGARLAPDIWGPAVVIAAFDREHGGQTFGAADSGAGLSVITTSGGPCAENAGWKLRRDAGPWIIDPLGITIDPQRLDLATLPALADLMDTVPLTQPSPPTPSPVEGPAEQSRPALDAVEHHTQEPATRPTASLAVTESLHAPADEPNLDHIALDPPAASPAAPRVLLLGPVDITGVPDDGAPGRRRRATELVVYLALHPGATQYQLDEALWPGARVSPNTRNPLVSRTRQWLGTNPDGRHYLGLVGEGGHYTLAPSVTCDWHDFCALAKRGRAAGPAGVSDLIAALDLVRGRPFLGVNPAAYSWAEPDVQDMISAIVDVALALADQSLAAGQHRRARWAAARGLAAEPFAEHLYVAGARAASAMGDHTEAERLLAVMRDQLRDLDPEDDIDSDLAAMLLSSRPK